MTIRNLDALFEPRTIALIGASNSPGSVGQVLARNLLGGGYEGSVFPVNPHEADICGIRCYARIADLPLVPDLAVVATPPATLPDIIAELGARGCRAAVVITAGFDPALRDKMLAAGRPHVMRIVGPNCLGFLSPVSGINASFAHLTPQRGRLAFLTQSGAIATSMIDWAVGRNIGFSHIVSLGDMSDIDFGDLLDFLALDADTGAILIYAEGITQARKFLSAGRIASRAKPVIVVKGGRSRSGAAAAASHTGALAGADAVYDAVFRRAGMLRVDTLRNLFDAAETLASDLRVADDRLTILTNGGGLGVLAADALEAGGGQLGRLDAETIDRLDRVLPASWSRANPIDILGDAHGDRYEKALEVLAAANGNGAILVMNCPTGVADSLDAARAAVRMHEAHRQRPLLACWMGEATTSAPRSLLAAAGIPSYETPDEAVSGFLQLSEFSRNQRALYETPSAPVDTLPPRKPEANSIIARVIAEERTLLTEPEAKCVLAAYNIPVVETRTVATPQEAALAADAIGGQIVLKILSRDISHKTDVGGVRLNLVGEEATEQAARNMLTQIAANRPDARIDGFTVQPMITRPHAQELLLGATVDPTFGVCLMFGHGGVAAETISDRCIGLPPLNANLAKDMIGRTRVSRLLAGYRDRAPARLDAIADVLVALSDLMIDQPDILELDINPLLADGDGVIALDARIVVGKPKYGVARLAIRPYPAELVRPVSIGDFSVILRPIMPEDSGRLLEMARRTSPDDLRLRFHGGVGAGSERGAARLSQIDYDREMVFLADMPDGSVGGVVRLVFDPDFETAETAIIVRTDIQNRMIGRTLLSEALAYAASRGANRVWGDVLSENGPTLNLARKLGGALSPSPADPSLVRAEFKLANPPHRPAG